ncbi:MAG TPA: hypothetical protein PKM63_09710 [Panacibacter sp.]|mgnify:CR=1 FL=1|nr:hypothetical protein [Panacibacter sp.]HNP44549.1 hypothetical protein [Panacibacter sp.]
MRKLLLLLLLNFPLCLLAQGLTTQTVKENIENYASEYQQEKMYLQFDKPVYSPGETVWFKAYFMAGTESVSFSASAYFDFADPSGKILKHVVEPVVQASAYGSFDIPVNYTGTSVQIKAYTKWMLNFDSAFLYSKTLRVIQTKPSPAKTPAKESKVSLQFFPEGGDCIAGINCKIAFKAAYADGRPFNVKGSIVNSKGAAVADVKTIHDGMGFFTLETKAGETYVANWKDDQGRTVQTALPAVKKDGLSIEVKLAGNRRNFVIKRSDNAPPAMNKVNIVGTMSGQLVYMASVRLENTQVIGGSIPVDQFPSGILQLTLFDSNWIAVAERITFVNNNDYTFEPEVGFATLGTGKRGKNVLVVNIPDTVNANLSVSVTDAGIGIDSSGNIVSNLLLTSDIRGLVYKPDYYFKDDSDSLQQQLDLVMLTNGWRRIKWDEAVNGKTPKITYQPDSAYLSLSGKIFGASSLDLKQSALLFLIIDHPIDSTRQALQTSIRPDGTFSEPNVILYDTTKVYYQFIGNKDLVNSSEVSFSGSVINDPPKVHEATGWLYPDSAAEARNIYFAQQQAMLQKLLAGTTLEGVTVKAKTKSHEQVLDEKYASGLFSGGNSKQFDVEADPASQAAISVLSYLQGKVAGLQIFTGPNGSTQNSASWRGGTPNFYLDEMQVDINQISSIPMPTVAYVKVFEPPFFGPGSGGGSGAIAVYTKRGGSDPAPKKGKGMPVKILVGYTAEKQFYSPNYGTFDQRNSWEDQRSTLYWNPNVYTTPKNHIIRLPFYNNDVTNSFRVILEGVNKDGKLTHIEKLIE